MSDYKGAALMLPALPKANELLADRGYDADWFRAALAGRGIAACIPRNPIGKSRSPMTPSSIDNATRSRTCLAGSRTGGASTPDMTVAPTPASRQSASPLSSSFGSDQ